jgi:hypothetical protein
MTTDQLRTWLQDHEDSPADTPAREALLLALTVAEACLDWAKDTEGCHLCGRGESHGRAHDEDCPVAVLKRVLA